MKKKIIIAFTSCAVFIIIAGFVNRWLWEKKEAEVMRLRNEGYMYILSIEGEFRYTPNTVEVIEMSVNEQQLLLDVILYNEFHNSEEITMEQMLEEYDNFCNNSGSTEELDAFCNFDRADEFDSEEYPLSRYKANVYNYLEERFNLEYFDQATQAQLQEAAEYSARKWKEDMRGY